jgi:enediyne biosynthesis protein E4
VFYAATKVAYYILPTTFNTKKQMRLLKISFLAIIIFFSNCQSKEKNALFKKLTAQQTGIDFKNQLQYTDSLTVLEFEYMFNGAGVALIDINNDGLQDVFFTGNMVSSKLYLNKGNLKFEDITTKAGVNTEGWCYGVSIVDINQDGFSDISVCKAGNRKTKPEDMKNYFFINNGNNTFTNKAAEIGLDEDGYAIQTAFLDYDKDGDLDMYLLKNAIVNYNRNNVRQKQTEGQAPSNDKLFRNDSPPTPKGGAGNGLTPLFGVAGLHFTDVSKEAGITIEGFGLGVSICDLNEDGYPDIYVSNDFLTNDLVWINNKNGSFTNKAHDLLRHTTYNGMGNDVSDYNNDGHPDIMVVDMLPPDNRRWKLTMMGNQYDEFEKTMNLGYEPQYVRNTLQLNNGDGSFSEIGQLAGVHATEWSWSPLFADYDNDGLKDLFIANGYRQDITNLDFIMYGKKALYMGSADGNRKERMDELNKYPGVRLHNFLYKNKGDLTFSDESENWGMTDEKYANGSAYADLDNDGDLDLITNNLDETSIVYENQLNKLNPDNNWLRLNFKGAEGNIGGLGTKIWLYQADTMQFQYFSPYRGYMSTVENLVHFGLKDKPIDSIKVRWADGKEQVLTNVKSKQVLSLEYINAAPPAPRRGELGSRVALDSPPLGVGGLTDFTTQSGINYLHQEDNFVDFKIQPLLQQQHSRLGPGLAVGDVNGDKLEDFYVGAALGGKGVIYIQQKNNTFKPQFMPEINTADDMGALFFDADRDGDVDLYIVSGGTNFQKEGESNYLHRLFLNDGKGNFKKDANAIPPSVSASGSSIVAADFDHDGDLDLFIGGRVKAGEYPLAPRSFLLQNIAHANPQMRGFTASFIDATPSVLATIGMVTSALWTDIDNDTWQDLIIVGEFMPITIFKNEQGKISNKPLTINNSSGWNNSLVGGDFDKDGDIDYIVGNLGLNAQMRANEKNPICVYGKDFDKNGRIDPILCHYYEGKEYMYHARDDMSKQIPAMRARFNTYAEYADVVFSKAFRPDEVKDATTLKSTHFESSYLENLGNNQFKLHDLPLEAQFSPIFGMLAEDFDGDGNLDVLAVGNAFHGEVNVGRYDAQGSLLLRGDGKGHFVADRKTFNIGGDNKSLISLTAGANSLVIVGANSEKLKVFKSNQKPANKPISIANTEGYALITEKSGRQYRQEFYFGQSYLSQSERVFKPSANVKMVEFFDYFDKKRTVNF